MNYTRPLESTDGEVKKVEVTGDGEIQLFIASPMYITRKTGIKVLSALSLKPGEDVVAGTFSLKRMPVATDVLYIYYQHGKGDAHSCAVYRPYLRKAAKRGRHV